MEALIIKQDAKIDKLNNEITKRKEDIRELKNKVDDLEQTQLSNKAILSGPRILREMQSELPSRTVDVEQVTALMNEVFIVQYEKIRNTRCY